MEIRQDGSEYLFQFKNFLIKSIFFQKQRER